MRIFLFILAFAFVILSWVFTPNANAFILNDSNSIDFVSDDYVFPNSGTGGPSNTPNASPDTPQSGLGNGALSDANDSDEPAVSVVETVHVDYVENSTSQGSDSETGEGIGEGTEKNAMEILGTLTGNQAVSVRGGDSSGGWSVTVNGTSVRQSLAARGIKGFAIGEFGSSGDSTLIFRTGEDFALVAASTVLSNSSLEEVKLSLSAVHISYRARARLFAVIPLTYRVRITVNPDEPVLKSRVIVKFPWYRFFLQTYVSRKDIENDVQSALGAIPKDSDPVDRRARLVVEISKALQARFDTVEESFSAN